MKCEIVVIRQIERKLRRKIGYKVCKWHRLLKIFTKDETRKIADRSEHEMYPARTKNEQEYKEDIPSSSQRDENGFRCKTIEKSSAYTEALLIILHPEAT